MNWKNLTPTTDLMTMTNSQLNVLLGTVEGEPKYGSGKMKSITKSELVKELSLLVAQMEAERPPVVDKKPRGTGISKNKACAASKQTNLLKAIVNGTMTVEEANARWDADPVMQEYCPSDKWATLIDGAIHGKRPGAARVFTTLTIEID